MRHQTWGASNCGVAGWGEVLGDTTVAAAMLYRLLHRSVVLNLYGDSYRLRDHHAKNEAPRTNSDGHPPTATVTPAQGGNSDQHPPGSFGKGYHNIFFFFFFFFFIYIYRKKKKKKKKKIYSVRRTLHSGAELLTDKQAQRLQDCFAVDDHLAVEATWGTTSG